MDHNDLYNRFRYHKPDATAARNHEDVRDLFIHIAKDLDEVLPEGREKSLVITKLEEAMFWSNAAIARQTEIGELEDHPAMQPGVDFDNA
jgi:hypothetical protein